MKINTQSHLFYNVVTLDLSLILVFLCPAASMARKIYLQAGIGVGAFRRIYGKAVIAVRLAV